MTVRKNYFLSLMVMAIFSHTHAQTKVENFPGLYFDKYSNQYFINNQAKFKLKPVEDAKYIDKILLSIDNQSFSDYGGGIQFEKEGFHIVRFKAVDPVLNWSPVESFRIYVDLTPPQTHFEWIGESFVKDSQLYIGPKSKLKLTSYDNLSGISQVFYSMADKTISYKSPLVFSEPGDYSLKVSSADNVGNKEEWKSLSFKVDTDLPTVSANVQGNSFRKGDKLFIDKGSFIVLEGNDKSSGIEKIEYVLNNSSAKTYKQTISVEEKTTKLKFRAIDNVGNKSAWQSLVVFMDAEAPKLAVKNQGKFKKIAGRYYAKPGFKVDVVLTDSESGAHRLVADNEKPQATESKSYAFKEKGTFEFSVRGEDKVGNVSDTVNYTVVIDDEPPKSEMKSTNTMVTKDGFVMSSLPNKLVFSANDSDVGVEYIEVSYDKKSWTKITAPIDLATWKQPKKTIYYRAVDQLGNKELEKSLSIHVRNRGPRVGLFVEGGGFPEVPLSKLDQLYKNGSQKRSFDRLPASEVKAGGKKSVAPAKKTVSKRKVKKSNKKKRKSRKK